MDKKNTNKSFKNYFKRFWNYLWYDDSIGSYILNFFVALVFIKFIFFPAIGFVLNTEIPVVAIVSGSMEHKIVNGKVCGNPFSSISSASLSYEEYWNYCGEYYKENFNIEKNEFQSFDYSNGLNIGDVIILYGKSPKDIEIGDVLVFRPGDDRWYAQNGPVIHRVVDKKQQNGEYVFTTKGDSNPSVASGNFERNITEDQIFAVANARIPFIGYLKVGVVRIMEMIV